MSRLGRRRWAVLVSFGLILAPIGCGGSKEASHESAKAKQAVSEGNEPGKGRTQSVKTPLNPVAGDGGSTGRERGEQAGSSPLRIAPGEVTVDRARESVERHMRRIERSSGTSGDDR